MGQATRPPHFDNHRSHAVRRFQDDEEELTALRDENKQLRDLVIQLSKLVIKNVVEHK
jgi:hypothetical protein